jgi:hypothetical protein
MTSITYANSTDLSSWANTRNSQSTLPQLIRRLVRATVDSPSKVDFPADEAVQLSGWDGIVSTEHGNSFVPSGISVWELGVNRNPKDKADKDYMKRSKDPLGIDPKLSTFVFVTARRWGGKDDWVSTHKAEGVWLDVIAYDADDLEHWLEIAPVVHVWISILLGKHPDDAIDLVSFLDEFNGKTQFPIPNEFSLAGRHNIQQLVRDWIQNPLQPLLLQADTREEALSVFTASVQELEDIDRELVLNRTIIIYNQASWRKIIRTDTPLILIPIFESKGLVSSALTYKHQIFIPLGRSDPTKNAIQIPRLSRGVAASCLKEHGIPEEKAQELAAIARRSFTSFLREISIIPEDFVPKWAQSENAHSILPFLLVGKWDETNAGDRNVLERMFNLSYEQINNLVVRWIYEDDPPIRITGNIVLTVSKKDGWFFISKYCTNDDFQLFKKLAIEILSAQNPAFDLTTDKRWAASLYGSAPQNSSELVEGISDTLAMIGTYSNDVSTLFTIDLQQYIGSIVSIILRKANDNWKVWASLSNNLPLLAEAAPDVFLAAVEEGLTGDYPVLTDIFVDADGIFTSSPHTGLLWALETIAWNDKLLGSVAIILARLARLDPGGKLANRPKNSLRTIFLPWCPQTTAPLEVRLTIIDTLRKVEQEIAWQLMISILPQMHDNGSPTAKPEWRGWGEGFSEGATRTEVITHANETITRLLSDVGFIGTRWKDIIEALPNMPIEKFHEVCEALMDLPVEKLTPSDITLLSNTLRSLISHHRSFPKSDWALPKAKVDILIPIFEKFQPTNIFDKYGWLFSNQPNLLEGREDDWESYTVSTTKYQIEAIHRIYSIEGISGILDIVDRVDRPEMVGKSLGGTDCCMEAGIEDELLQKYLGNTGPEARFIHGFISERYQLYGRGWAFEKYLNQGKDWSPKQRGEYLSCLPPDGEIWGLACTYGSETEHEFWVAFQPFSIQNEDYQYASTCLLQHGRPYSAAYLLAFRNRKEVSISPELIEEVLRNTLEISPNEDPIYNDLGYTLGVLLDDLHNTNCIDESRIAYLEWNLFPVLRRHERQPIVLQRALANDPKFFVEVVSYAFRSEGEEPQEISEEVRYRATRAYELLQSWRIVPGLKEDGNIDPQALSEWVYSAREKLLEIGRLHAGDNIIGQVLSGSPVDPDGNWPHLVIRDLLQTTANFEIENGIIQGVINSRGVTSRGSGDGGKQEHVLADKYIAMSDAIGYRWPRTAAMLKRISDEYRLYANHEDLDDELYEDLN